MIYEAECPRCHQLCYQDNLRRVDEGIVEFRCSHCLELFHLSVEDCA